MSVHDRPTAAELVAAVREYILAEVAEGEADRRKRFRALIAANVLAVVERELANDAADESAEDEALRSLGYGDGTPEERRAQLCADIRAGAHDAPETFRPMFEYALAAVERKLAVANPRFKR